ncbi:MAG: DEAD/DEAH box helicase [Spirochaetales bacterium]|nr:DEAD/DEAH box helicase [Spirochaetales bacterium]
MSTEIKKMGRLSSEVMRILGEAGFQKPTHLQELVLPPILDGKDVFVESGSLRGKTLTMIIPMVLRFKHDQKTIRGLVLTNKIEQAQKYVKFAKRLQREKSNSLFAAAIGFSDLIKKEARQLEENPTICVSTPHRLIDHIRRGNVDLSHVEMVFLDEDEIRGEEFVNDIFFIFSKLSRQFQTVRYVYPGQEGEDQLASLIRRQVVIQKKEFEKNKTSAGHAYYIAENRNMLVQHLIFSLHAEAPVIVAANEEEANILSKELKSAYLKGHAIDSKTNVEKTHKLFELLSMQLIDYIVINTSQWEKIRGKNVSHIIFHQVPRTEQEYMALCHPDIAGIELREIISVISKDAEPMFKEMIQRGKIVMEERANPQEHEAVIAAAKKMKEKMIDYIDQDEFKKTVKALKKAIPFGQRTLFASYLFFETAQRLLSRKAKFTTLFVNVGRTRDISAEEIKKHFCSKLNISPAQIKDVRMFDNYSFVEIDDEVAKKAIDTLSNTEFKGKSIAVSFSRKKPERRNFGPRRSR